jgi:hypothetical protein
MNPSHSGTANRNTDSKERQFGDQVLAEIKRARDKPVRELFPVEKRLTKKIGGHRRLTGHQAKELVGILDEVLTVKATFPSRDTVPTRDTPGNGTPESSPIEAGRKLYLGRGRLHVAGFGEIDGEQGPGLPWIEVDHSPESAIRSVDRFAAFLEAEEVLISGKERLRRLQSRLINLQTT